MKKYIKRMISGLLSAVTAVTVVVSSFPLTASADDTFNPKPKKPIVVVSLGDSYSAGEGIEEFYDQNLSLEERVKSHDWLAHRSTKSWPGRLEVETDGKCCTLSSYRVDHYDPDKPVNWFFVAASGAETKHMNQEFLKPYDKIRIDKIHWDGRVEKTRLTKKDTAPNCPALAPQLDVFTDNNLTDKVDYVTMTLGGNDVGFSKIIEKAVKANNDPIYGKLNLVLYLNDNNKKQSLKSMLEEKLDEWDNSISNRMWSVYHQIREKAGRNAYIIVAGYPKLFHEESGSVIKLSETRIINKKVTQLNNRIRKLVETYDRQFYGNTGHIVFVDVENAFDTDKKHKNNHGAYADNAWINGIMTHQAQDLDDTKDGLVSSYSIHPNDKGAAAYARCVQKAIDRIEKYKDKYFINGKIADASNYSPLDHVYIRIYHADTGILAADQIHTEKDGSYVYDLDKPGNYYILARLNGYEDTRFDFTVFENKHNTSLLPIYMKKPGTELKADDIIGGFGTHRYKVVNGEFTWNEAKALCESVGGHLATITSVEEQEFVSRFVHRQEGSSYYWLGASDEANEGTWTWVTGEPFSYQNWNEGEPNEFFDDNTEDYLEFRIYQNNPESEYGDYDDGLYYWNDRREESLDGFICEWDNKANVGKSVITSGHRYEIIDTGLTWESAKAACEAKGGHLATITSQEEQNAVEVLLGNGHKHNYWLGGMIPEDTVIWITGEESDYTSFGSWLPDKYLPDEDKLMIWRIESEYSETNRWNDLRSDGTCEDQDFYGLTNFGYICEWDNVGKTETLNKSSKTANTRSAKAEPDAAVVTHALKTAPNTLGEPPFADLLPNTVYNVYAMRDTADGLTSYNLMYINQFTTDEDGKLTFDYGLKEDTDVQWIAVPFKLGNTEGAAEVTVAPAFAQNEERTYTDITLTVDGKTFTADSTGKITITGLADGTYEAVVSKPNYAPVNVTITVGGENADVTIYKYGDADKNGKVDQSDLALLQKYSAGWNVTVDKPIADVTLDGKVNGEDIALMQKYFAGWNVTLGKAS